MNDEKLEEKIEQIFNQYYLEVYRFLIYFSANPNDAEDMTQEVFIRVLNNMNNIGRLIHEKAWIFSIAKHVAIDHYRKRRVLSLFTKKLFHNQTHIHNNLDELFEQNELKKNIHKAISKLKPTYRAVVIFRGINEFSIKETAEILQCSEAKVKVDYHRALKELKKKLKMDDGEAIEYAK